jgi:hypothetical protein
MIREIHEAVQQGISPIEIDLESPERKHCFERLKSEYKVLQFDTPRIKLSDIQSGRMPRGEYAKQRQRPKPLTGLRGNWQTVLANLEVAAKTEADAVEARKREDAHLSLHRKSDAREHIKLYLAIIAIIIPAFGLLVSVAALCITHGIAVPLPTQECDQPQLQSEPSDVQPDKQASQESSSPFRAENMPQVVSQHTELPFLTEPPPPPW